MLVYAAHKPPLQGYRSEVYDVFDIVIDNDAAYSIGMASCYENKRPFVNVEHDMQVSDERITALFDCPHLFCTWAYKIHTPHIINLNTGNIDGRMPGEPFYAQQKLQDGHLAPVMPGESHSRTSGIGFCKINPDGRDFPIVHWTDVEKYVNELCQNTPPRAWHIHWPEVEHWHR